MMGTKKTNERGASLVEMLVTLTIVMVMAQGVFICLDPSQVRYIAQGNMVEAQQNARVAIEALSSYIEQAGNNPYNVASINANAIVPISSTSFRVVTDRQGDTVGDKTHHSNTQGDPDGDTTDDYEDVTITYNATTREIQMTTNIGGVSQTSALAKNISAANFDYLDGSGNPTSTATQIRAVRVTLTASTLPAGTQPQGVSFQQGRFVLTCTFQIRSRGLIRAL